MPTTVTKIDTYTVRDEAGNPRTIGWFEVEFTGAYDAGGMSVDLSPYFRHISDIHARPSHGHENLIPVPDEASFVTPASVRIRLMGNIGGTTATIAALNMVEPDTPLTLAGSKVRLQVLGF